VTNWTLAQVKFKVKDIIGEKIGHGYYREVFQYALNPRLVVKRIRKRVDCQHENITEYTNWRNLREITTISDLLVPVEDISVCGRYLLMLKTSPIVNMQLSSLPKYVPVGYCDGKIDQLSRLNKRTMIHDYGCNILRPKLKQVNPIHFWKIK
jgi:hypothetical protein